MEPVPANASTGMARTFHFNDVIDGYVYTASPAETMAEGKQNDVPNIAGGNRDEGGLTADYAITVDALRKLLQQRYADMADESETLWTGYDGTTGGCRYSPEHVGPESDLAVSLDSEAREDVADKSFYLFLDTPYARSGRGKIWRVPYV